MDPCFLIHSIFVNDLQQAGEGFMSTRTAGVLAK